MPPIDQLWGKAESSQRNVLHFFCPSWLSAVKFSACPMSGRRFTQHKCFPAVNSISFRLVLLQVLSVSVHRGWRPGDYANKIPNYQIAITVQVLLAPDSSITTLLTTLISVSWEKTLWSLSKYSHHFGGSILESHGSSNYFLSKSRRQHVTSCTISQVRNTPANKQPRRAFFITATFGNCLYY